VGSGPGPPQTIFRYRAQKQAAGRSQPVQNAIAWFEIPVIDFDRARKFYETIFGATFQVLKLGQGPTLALSRSTSLGA
jgi:hypothetical protein